ncbi:NEAT domain-containing protein [Halalkalibacter sp. APA_J-10(15)]|uniref:NEAT domain-containing protein n=1 Tax=Halalkalibacter sp. APA_J-10(15) TaxID=2933805 RepID=UPI001FF4E6A3|nr:NEAT domain-containing protein [Halalkalibacter sp. APA_J-10(15)]MCK0471985.1 NEAT domain-containing protein [Halalkalibacter sp. APA_J-10(15)]
MKLKFKQLTILSLIFLLIFSSFSSIAVAETEGQTLQNGEYEIHFSVLKDGTDETSVMDGYTEKPASLYVSDDELTVDLTLTSSDWIKVFQTDINGTFTDAEVISENEEEDTRVVRFTVTNLSSKLDVFTHVVIPFINYDNEYVVQITFDEDSLEVVELEELPEPVPALELADGTYTIDFEALHATEDRASAMAGYLTNPATLSVAGENVSLTLEIQEREGQELTDVRLLHNGEYKSGTVESENEEELSRVVTYDINAVAEIAAEVDMYVAAANYSNTQSFRIVLDEESAQLLQEDEGSNEDEESNEEESNENEGDEANDLQLADGTYTIDFEALHATEDRASAMAGYLTNPATLSVAGENMSLTLEIQEREGQELTDVRLLHNGEFKSGTVESENEEELSRVVTYDINAVTEIAAEVDMYVAAANYSNTQSFRIVLDEESAQLVQNHEEENEESNEEEIDENEDGNHDDGVIENEDDEFDEGTYTIDFTVYKNQTTDISVMDEYTVKPAHLMIEGDTQTVEMTLTHSDWIKVFQTEKNGNYVDVEVVSEDSSENTRTVQFEVEDLSQLLHAYTEVYFEEPFLYDGKYEVQIAFDLESMEVFDENTSNEDDTNGENEHNNNNNNNSTNKDVDDLTINRDGQDHDNDKNDPSTNQETNAKTADRAMIGGLILLMLTSGIWLFRKYRLGTL